MERQEFFTQLCGQLGFEPTPWRLAVFDFWATQENMPEETNNFLATTQPGDLNLAFNKGYGPGNWNSVPVRVYRTAEAGVQATRETLTNGYYPNILRCFRDQIGYNEAVGPRDFVSWVGQEDYGRRVVDFMNACTADKEMEMTYEQFEEFFQKAMGRLFPAYIEAYFAGGFTARNSQIDPGEASDTGPIKPWIQDISDMMRGGR